MADGADGAAYDTVAHAAPHEFIQTLHAQGENIQLQIVNLYKGTQSLSGHPNARVAGLAKFQRTYIRHLSSLLAPAESPNPELEDSASFLSFSQAILSGKWSEFPVVLLIREMQDRRITIPNVDEWGCKHDNCHAWKEPDQHANALVGAAPGTWHHHFVPFSQVQVGQVLLRFPRLFDAVMPPADAGGFEQLMGKYLELIQLEVPPMLGMQWLHLVLKRVDECLKHNRIGMPTTHYSLRTPKQLATKVAQAQARATAQPLNVQFADEHADVAKLVSIYTDTTLIEKHAELVKDAKEARRISTTSSMAEQAKRAQEEVHAAIYATPPSNKRQKTPRAATGSAGKQKATLQDAASDDEVAVDERATETAALAKAIGSQIKAGFDSLKQQLKQRGPTGGKGGQRDPTRAPGGRGGQREPKAKPGTKLTGLQTVPEGGWKVPPAKWENYPPVAALKVAHKNIVGEPRDLPEGRSECMRNIYAQCSNHKSGRKCQWFHSKTSLTDEQKVRVANEAARLWEEGELGDEETD